MKVGVYVQNASHALVHTVHSTAAYAAEPYPPVGTILSMEALSIVWNNRRLSHSVTYIMPAYVTMGGYSCRSGYASHEL